MRFLLTLFLFSNLYAISNSITVTNPSASSLTNRVKTISRPFVQDEICDYPQPYIAGVAATTWQSEHINRWPATATCPSGSVKKASISWVNTYSGLSNTDISFRNNTNPCSSGNQAACDAAALNKAGMLAYGGGTWAASITLVPNPSGTATAATFNARTVLDADRYEYYLRGPAVTQVIVGDKTSTRTDDFGWYDWRHNLMNTNGGLILATDTAIPVLSGDKWATLPRPFIVAVDAEQISICFVSGNMLYVGTTNGSSTSCATTAGRGVNGSTASFHSFTANGNYLRLVDQMYLTANFTSPSATTLTVNDASTISSPVVLQIGTEQVRVCNKSGNVLTVGVGSWGCAANVGGRNYNGASPYGTNSNFWNSFMAVYNLNTETDRWIDAPNLTFKSLHPEAVLTFPASGSAVGVYFIIANDYLTSVQDAEYDVSISVGGSTVYTQNEIRHIARTSNRFPVYNQNDSMYWSGTAPGYLRINHNHSYLVQTGAISHTPFINVSANFTNSLLINDFPTSDRPEPAWNGGNNDKCVADTRTILTGAYNYVKGSMLRNIDTAGGRPDIGGRSLWDIAAIYSGTLNNTTGDSLEEMSYSMVNCFAQIPYWYRETSTSAWCNNGDYPANPLDKSCTGANLSASAFGRFLSIDLHPTATPFNQNTVTVMADRVIPIGVSTANLFRINAGAVSHLSSTFFPALVTDDYFTYEITTRLGGNMIHMNEFSGYFPTATTLDRTKYRHEDWGIQNRVDGVRRLAWSYRNWLISWYIARDGTPEKEYIASKINRNIAVLEGMYNQTNGNFYIPCPTPLGTSFDYSPWCYGRTFYALQSAINTTFPSEPGGPWSTESQYSILRNWNGDSPWMRNYLLVALGEGDRLGFTTISSIRQYIAGGMLTQSILHPDWSFWFESYYRNPQTPCIPEGTDVSPNCSSQSMTNGSQWQYNSWSNKKAAFTYPLGGPSVGGNPTGPAATSAESDMLSGYSQIAAAALALNKDSSFNTYTGQKANDIFYQNLRFRNTCPDNPMWCYIPRPNWNITVTPGDTTALFTGAPPYTGACKILVSASRITNSDDAGDTTCTYAGNQLRHVTASLTASTTYYYRVTVNDVNRIYGTFTTTSSAGGAATVTLRLKSPAGYGTVNDVVTEYGNTTGLGTSVTTSCASTCTVNLSGNTGRVIYYKNTWRNSTPTNLISTSILSQMVQ